MQNPAYKRKCEEVDCKRPAIHIHHKDKDHSNNNPDNLIYLCASCHLKEHPRDNELRPFDMVDYLQSHRTGYRLKAGFNMLNEDYS